MKYTIEILAPAVANNTSYAGVLRNLGLRQTGGSQGNIKKLVEKHGLSTAHFLGHAHMKGCPSKRKLSWQEVLVLDRNNGQREHAFRLRCAMIRSGIKEECTECRLGPEWNGKHLRLQMDHKNGNSIDNRRENLRFLCPNCHAQTDNFGIANSYWNARERGGMADTQA